MGLPSGFHYTCGLAVAAQVDGILNRWQDRYRSWTGELAMPISDLTAQGARFGPQANWRILIGRDNYSRYLTTQGPELSMASPLRTVNYHLYKDYAWLRLEE